MERFGDLLKKSQYQFARGMLKKQFPALANTEFELDIRNEPCSECGQRDIPEYWIKRINDDEFKKAPVTTPCPLCEDRKFAKETQIRNEKRRIEKETSEFWMVPEEIKSASIENFIPDDKATAEALAIATQYVKDYENGDRYNILFRGTYGGGKSHLMKGIAERIKHMDKGDGIPFKVGFLTFESLLSMIKSTWNKKDGNTDEHDIIRKMIDLDLLVLDDIGTESGEWSAKILFQIINGRQGKATGYTTNNQMDELKNIWGMNGGKIVSRLHQNTKIVDIMTDDKRIQNQR